MKKLLATLAALAVAAGGILASGVLSAGSAAVAASAAPISAQQAEQIALVRATAASDPTPQIAVQSETLGDAAVAMGATQAGASVPTPSSSVYLVTMHGHFVLGQAHVPPHHGAPKGDVLKVAVGADGFVYGLHVGNEE